ncbi:hypothetical protein AR687_17760 [Flavobacteriaceae bacterium CRH]|nr:hypothetical protein AR687_17760 [Flavobacteriaceae bacterium CRH]
MTNRRNLKKLIFLILSIFGVFNSCQKTITKKFKESEKTVVFTTKFVVLENKEITSVYHYKEDNCWQFYSNDKFENYTEVAMLVGLGQIIKRDKTILEIADLPEGYFAFRKSKGEKWTIEKITD